MILIFFFINSLKFKWDPKKDKNRVDDPKIQS